MGIPHLVRSLEPYATTRTYPPARVITTAADSQSQDRGLRVDNTRNNTRKESAIIDGPALAFHAYSRAIARRSFARNALEALPSYSEVNLIAVECLEVLEKHGFPIAAIFFDGFLPLSKIGVRKGRLDSSLKQMEGFRIQHSTGVELRANNSGLPKPDAEDAFSNIHVSAKARSLPALPFLVPSVIEALAQSRFAGKTKVVPAEADAYCASYAKDNGGTIVTSDSDLLAYDLGPNGYVLLFKDIELEGIDPTTKLKMSRYETSCIAQRLEVSTLQPLAFMIRQNHYLGFTKCLSQARQLGEDVSNEFKAFLVEYSLPNICTVGYDQDIRHILQWLDPRVSEWILQALPDGNFKAEQWYDMFLPFLIEDTTRVSAWNMGADLRLLTYSMLKPLAAQTRVTAEFARRGIRIANTPKEHFSQTDAEQSLNAVSEMLEKVLGSCKGTVVWRLLGLYILCHTLLEEGKRELPARNYLRKLLGGQTVGRDWTFLHCSAQFQAALYSLRMLKQAISVVCVVSSNQRGDAYVAAAAAGAARVHRLLGKLPEIRDLFDSTMKIEDEELDAYIDTLYRLLGMNEASLSLQAEAAKGNTSNKKKRKKDKTKPRVPNAGPLASFSSSNMFDLLPSSP
jgi:hypothetical protein